MTLGELRDLLEANPMLPNDMPVQYVTKRGDVKEVVEMGFDPYTQSLVLREKELKQR